MKVYDIALTLIRTLVALDLIRQVGDALFAALRMVLDVTSAGHTRLTEVSSLMGAGFSILVLLTVWAASRPIARFATSFADAPA